MAYYLFEKRGTEHEEPYCLSTGRTYTIRDNENLSTVDEEVCRYWGDPCHEKHYHPCYAMLVEWCFAALLSLGGASIEEKHIDWIMEHGYVPQGYRKCLEFRRFYEHMLLEKYVFSAGR